MNMKSNRLLFILIFFNLFLVGVYSQESVTISYNGNRNYVFTERTDLRRYDNGKYVGLLIAAGLITGGSIIARIIISVAETL